VKHSRRRMALPMEQLDVLTAFLNSELKEVIYVDLPEGFEQAGKVCLLHKTLYGLKQSPREWYETLRGFLLSIGFTRTYADHSVFVSKSRVVILVVYVDDILLFGPQLTEIAYVKKQLANSFKMSDMGPAKSYLGMDIARDRDAGTIRLSQTKFVEKILERFEFEPGKKVTSTPMDSKIELYPSTESPDSERTLLYQSILGSLMYVMLCTRPDLAFCVSKLSRYASNASTTHLTAAKRVLRYLRTTANRGIAYKRNAGGLSGYTDANWAGGTEDCGYSTSGYLFVLASGPISWSSKRQNTVPKE
jgi:Reverse transcriptase (RNA-dependent DNA polymerase)